jgi:hypothetical protein
MNKQIWATFKQKEKRLILEIRKGSFPFRKMGPLPKICEVKQEGMGIVDELLQS